MGVGRWAKLGKKTFFYLFFHKKHTTILIMKQTTLKNPELTFLQVRMEKSTVEKAKEQAKKAGLSLSLVVRKLLEDYVNDPQPKLIFG